MRIIKQIIRGCGTLPHVGEHPGSGLVLMLLLAGACAGYKGEWLGALFGAGVMAAVFVPMYFYGAYCRAQDSDAYEREKG